MEQPTIQSEQQTPTILVVEDESAGRNLLAAALKRFGMGSILCADGQEAVDCFREQQAAISLVLMDLNMPRMGGSEAFEQMVAMDPDVRVIIMTGFREADEIQGLLQCGVQSILYKPFHLNELKTTLQKHL
ncbi:MAG: response regulator [Phycisphaerales bacterium]|jgi:two-component system, cell cycle sensor histidine kinase and response regulator CckA|nr:response regulator [Phycisphaerales bacterium]MBT7170533.1 response regulator [Phycisphaerales bacterium]